MRCESVQALWASSPPLHHVVDTAVLNHPPSLYTGGSDGAIVWWKLSSQQEIWPVAMLCGHTVSIAGLAICTPGNDHKETHSLVDKSSPSEISEALISACVDGVLCTWSSLSGHCRRRRKMPPWVGSVSVLSCLPSSRRYVCIACTCVNAGQAQTWHASEVIADRNAGASTKEATLDGEGILKKMAKCAIVIIDSLNLNIVKVIFHGFLSIGTVNSMAIVPDMMTERTELVMVSDLFGRIQYFELNEENITATEAAKNSEKSDHTHVSTIDSTNANLDGASIVSIAPNGKLVLLIYKSQWIVKSSKGGVLIDESCVDSLLCRKCPSGPPFLIGGMFLTEGNYKCNELKVSETEYNIVTNVVIWNNQGAAVIYGILQLGHSSYARALFQVPPISSVPEGDLCIKFDLMQDYLIRIESVRSDFGLSTFRETHITIWLPLHAASCVQSQGDLDACSKVSTYNIHLDGCCMAVMLGQGGFWGDWSKTSSSSYGDISPINNCKEMTDSFEENLQKVVKVGSSDAEYSGCLGRETNFIDCFSGNETKLIERNQIITSSMILSGKFSVPLALVYGFCSGEIKIVRFECLCPSIFTGEDKLQNKHNPSMALQSFRGHTGPILCLAAHKMLVTTTESSRHILVSGSMDCTIRLWDLEGGSLISIMHQHIAPVRQILLPAPWTDRPWAECFLSISDDACVSLSSFETLNVERMFPGHPSYPKMVAWDSLRGYIACLCVQYTTHGGHNDILYIWDVKSGARERILKGAAAHSMFDHFLRCIHINSTTSKVLDLSTSMSSLMFHSNEEANLDLHGTIKPEKGLGSAGSKSFSRGTGSTELVDLTTKKSEGNFEKLSSKMVQVFGQGVKAASSASSSGDANSSNYLSQISSQQIYNNKQRLIKGACPYPGVAALQFDLSSLMASDLIQLPVFEKHETKNNQPDLSLGSSHTSRIESQTQNTCNTASKDSQVVIKDSEHHLNCWDENAWLGTIEGHLLRMSLSFLHLWGADDHLDKLLIEEMNISKPENVGVAAGLPGDRGSLTLLLPGWRATFELWKSSAEFCAMRSLTMVSLAQRIIKLSRPSSAASSALAAFYTRSFVEKFPDIKPPLLELYACFWQDPSEHVRMAARTLFHCAAARAIPIILRCERLNIINSPEREGTTLVANSDLKMDSGQSSLSELTEILNWLDSYEAEDWIPMIGGTDGDAKASRIIVGAALAVWYPSLVKSNLAIAVASQLVKLVMTVNGRHSPTAAELLAEGMDTTWHSHIASDIPHLIRDVFLLIECLSGSASGNAGSIQNPVIAMTIRETLTGILLPSLAMADVLGYLHVVENQIWTTGSDSPVHLVSLMTLVRIIRGAPKAMVPYLDKVTNYILQTMDTGNSVLRKSCLQSAMAALREMVRIFPMVALNQSSTRLAAGDAVGDIRTLSIQIYDLQSVTKLKVLDASGPPGLPTLLAGNTALSTGGISALSFSPDGESHEWGMPDESSTTPTPKFDLSYRLEWKPSKNVALLQHGQELGIFQL
ncbi:uncharacterized protein LOC131036328 isoform X2 [Cryptomeria japonica]|uniref:uncharacterized protein LOC131036328 isoform X2 n=1 Tax=Cryptomeria japonica TaxID=3369 RepID=UPI0027DA25C5|nr:uncharacterized protein LOC131036328 isoform X2 [Cryptomeria japonica]